MNDITATHHPEAKWKGAGSPEFYVQGLAGRPQLWRSMLAVLAGLGAMAGVLFVAVVPLGAALDRMLGVTPFDPDIPSFTIGYWIAGNLLLAALIPASGLLQWGIYRTRPGYLSSLHGGFRWRVLIRAAVVVVPLWIIYMLALQLVMPTGEIEVTWATVALSIAALITVPLQAAGEEYLFRGLLFRAVGARFRRPAVAMIFATAITALLFAAIHGSTDGWAFAYYTVFGACFATIAQVTGGLEVGVLVHATNNTLLLIPTILAGRLASVSVTTGPILLIPMIVILVFTTLVWRFAPAITKEYSPGS